MCNLQRCFSIRNPHYALVPWGQMLTGAGERLVTNNRFSWTVSECWRDHKPIVLSRRGEGRKYHVMRCKADSIAESVTDAIQVAAESMGYPKLRRLQETAVRAFVTGRDVFVSIPRVVTSRCVIRCYQACSTFTGGASHSSWRACNLGTLCCEWEMPCYVTKINANNNIGSRLLRDVTLMKIPFHHENLLLVTRRSPPPVNVWPRKTNYACC